jgi:hypothetical protein
MYDCYDFDFMKSCLHDYLLYFIFLVKKIYCKYYKYYYKKILNIDMNKSIIIYRIHIKTTANY